MNLPGIGVKKPVTTAMIFFGIIILGAVSLSRLGLEMLPDIEIPTIMVLTTYEGAGPEEVEERITRVAEEGLATVEDLDRIEAFSSEGISGITLRFNWGANLDNAINDVRDKIDMVKAALPEDADDPMILKLDISMMPVLVYGVSSDERTFPHLKKILEDEIGTPLESVSGVASASVMGGMERAVLVELNSQRLKAYNLSVSQVKDILRASNLSTPGGNIRTGSTDYIVRVPEELELREIEDVVIFNYNGVPVKIKDVAAVRDDYKEITQETLVNRRPGLILMVQKESDANTVSVCRGVFKKMEELKQNIPSDIKFHIAMDTSDQVIKSIANLKNTLLTGGILVLVIIFMFLGNLRSSLIIASAIPISLIVTFIFLYMAGYTVNIISLSSLAIAIGMVVDAAIVTHENIHRHLENGEELQHSCLAGGTEVSGALVASVLCIVAIFIPIIFTGGITAIFFKQLAYVTSMALLASLFTALMLIPMLTSKFFSSKKAEVTGSKKKSIGEKVSLFTDAWFGKMVNTYEMFLLWALRHRKTVILLSLFFLVGSLFLTKFVGTAFIPETDEGSAEFNITLPVGTRYEKTGEVVKKIEDIIYEEVPETEMSYCRYGVGEGGLSSLIGGEEGSNIGSGGIKLISKEKRNRTPRQIAYDLKDRLNVFPDTDVLYSAGGMRSLMFGGAKPVSVELRGYDLIEARETSRRIAEILKGIEGVDDVEISRKEGKPELQVLIDREKASALGLSVAGISDTVATCFQGSVATYYREAGEEYDIEVRLREEDRNTLNALGDLLVTLPTGRQISLSQIATIEKSTGPLKIERKARERLVKIEGEIYGRDLGGVINEVKGSLKRLRLPPGFSIYFGGEFEEQQKSFAQLTLALILGIILVFMIMASQFESLIDPFVVMFAIPFSLIGVIWALFLTGNTLSIISFIGLIMVVGVGVETGIVLVSFIKQLREQGVELHQAVVEAGKLRLRPVLMTTLTTVFGLIPLALSRGEGSEMWVPLGFSILGGLAVSFFFTLFFIPVLYTIYEERILNRVGRNKK